MDYSIRCLYCTSYKYVSYESPGNYGKDFPFVPPTHLLILRPRAFIMYFRVRSPVTLTNHPPPLTVDVSSVAAAARLDSGEIYIRCIHLIKFLVERFSSRFHRPDTIITVIVIIVTIMCKNGFSVYVDRSGQGRPSASIRRSSAERRSPTAATDDFRNERVVVVVVDYSSGTTADPNTANVMISTVSGRLPRSSLR